MTQPQTYGDAYYTAYRGGPYERSATWLAQFAKVADRIAADIRPRTALDAGCAKGLLVEQLRERGVDAEGIDISDFAVSSAPEEVRAHLRVGSIAEPFGHRYDLIVSTEVLEHLEPDDCERAVANICAHTDDVLFSSTPSDFDEATHVNVRPPEYWAELFLRHGFVRDIDYDASYVAGWAVRFRRTRDPLERQIIAYERELARLRSEKFSRDDLLMRVDERIDALHAEAREQTGAREAETRERERVEGLLRRLDSDLISASRQIDELDDRRRQLEQHRAELERRLDVLESAMRGVPHRVAGRVHRVARRAMPHQTRRGDALTSAARAATVLREQGPRGLVERARRRRERRAALEDAPPPLDPANIRYHQWLAATEPDAEQLRLMRSASRSWAWRPVVSIVMPAYQSEPWYLIEAIESVRNQAYESWELCIADDASPSPAVQETLRRYADEPRIRTVRCERNGGIAAASQAAAELATGELVAFLDHDDVLAPQALYAAVRHLAAHPGERIVYSDEDKLDPHGRRIDVHFKPEWSPELLDSCNYMCHLTVMQRSLFDEAGGFRTGFDGSQDYDLFLRCTERVDGVGHIPEVLYSWRMLPQSAAASPEAKPAAYEAARRALQSACDRREERAFIEHGHVKGFYFVRRAIHGDPSVAVIIPTRDRVDLLQELLRSIEVNTGPRDLRIVIVDNCSTDPATRAFLDHGGHRVVRHPWPFNFSAIVNQGVREAGDVDHVLLLNNDMVVRTPTWLDGMLEHSQRSGIGAVGARLLFPDGSVQHEGVRIGAENQPAYHLDLSHYFGMGRCTRTVSAVTGACLMVKRSAWDEVGGFDERLRVMYNDVDFCLRLQKRGYRNVYTPLAELTHHHSASRSRALVLTEDVQAFVERWDPLRPGADPYLSAHLATLNPLSYG
jgi:GT2 family glycosyltransferase